MVFWFKKVFSIFLHLPFLVAIFLAVSPIANWYLSKTPALGVDLFNSITYVSYHLKKISLPFNSFKDIWFGGYPLMLDFPQFVFYLMTPFGAIFGEAFGVQVFAIASLFLFLVFSYLLFFQLSKNVGLALFLVILVALSVNIYGALTWAGSIPYFASQAFFPLGLFFGARYLEKPNTINLSLMILITGIGILIHPLGIVTFLVPSLLIIVIFGGIVNSFKPLVIGQHLIIYIVGFILVSFTITYDFFVTLFIGRKLPLIGTTSTSGVVQSLSPVAEAITQFYKSQIASLYTQTNFWFFVVLIGGFILFILSLPFIQNKRKAFLVLPFILIAGYCAAHPAANFSGILNFLRHDPYRAFWPFPVAIGALTAYLWGIFFSLILEKLELTGKIFLRVFYVLVIFALTTVFAVWGYSVFNNEKDKLINKIDTTSELSSAFPEALSISLKAEDLERLKKQVIPSFIDPADKNKRLYAADATVNIWWNSFFDLPLARGYLDPPIGTDRRGGFFWLDIAIANDTLVRDFKVPEDQAFANSLFLIDWYGIHYFEGGSLSSKGPSPPPSSYLLKKNIFDAEEEVTTYGAVLKWQTASGKPELHMELPQNLKFFKVADKFSSPILAPTNASTIAVFSSFSGYEDILRILGSENINSKKLVPVYPGKYIDDLSLDQLKTFDGVFIHQYKYRNKKKAFDLLEKYVRTGGKIFIDTGAESKESDATQLPEIFPFDSSTRQGWGKEWNFTSTEGDILKGVDLSQFGPPIFNESEWKLSTPKAGSNLREGSVILLTDKGNPVLVERSLGQGEIVWSGLNLPYHYNQYKSTAEAKLFINILSQFSDISEKESIAAETSWIKPEKVTIKTSARPRGILFKEEGYDGWSAKLTSGNGKKLPIYLAGPTYPGFMYVPLKDSNSTPVTVEFNYSGRLLYWFATFVNLAVIIFILERIFISGKLFGERLHSKINNLGRKFSFWWEKEEE